MHRLHYRHTKLKQNSSHYVTDVKGQRLWHIFSEPPRIHGRCSNSLITIKIKHTLLSGCDGGNGVYSFFTLFFLGSLRLDRFLWRNWGRNRSQLCILKSGSLDSSRLIISVWLFQPSQVAEKEKKKEKKESDILVVMYCQATSSDCTKMPVTDSWPQLQVEPEKLISVRRSRTRMENIFIGHECTL